MPLFAAIFMIVLSSSLQSVADDEVSTEGAVTPVSDRSTTPVSVVPQKRKANKTNAEAEVDKALLESVKGLQELTKTKREETNKPDVNFCLDIAKRLSGKTRQKNALVKMLLCTSNVVVLPWDLACSTVKILQKRISCVSCRFRIPIYMI